jgi:hypothetical protein
MLSGANIERQVTEFSELYTQVLLGLNQDLESQKKKLQEHTIQLEQLQGQVVSMGYGQGGNLQGYYATKDILDILERQRTSIRILGIFSSSAFLISLASLGLVLWTLL